MLPVKAVGVMGDKRTYEQVRFVLDVRTYETTITLVIVTTY